MCPEEEVKLKTRCFLFKETCHFQSNNWFKIQNIRESGMEHKEYSINKRYKVENIFESGNGT